MDESFVDELTDEQLEEVALVLCEREMCCAHHAHRHRRHHKHHHGSTAPVGLVIEAGTPEEKG